MASVFKKRCKSNRHGYYYVAWKDANGRWRRRCENTTDKDAAKRLAHDLETQAMLRREGTIDPSVERLAAERHRPLVEHLRDFEAKMRTSNATPRHVADTLRMIREALTTLKWRTAGDITPDSVYSFADHIRSGSGNREGKRRNRSSRTVQSYLVAIKSFTRWLATEGKLAADPLASVKRPSPAIDRRHERRALLTTEWPWLDAATRSGTMLYGMSGEQRAILYRLGVEKGKRSNELRALTSSSLRLADQQPSVVVKGRSTKNRKDARQFIQRDLAVQFGKLASAESPSSALFQLPHASNLARMLRADLAAARAAWLEAAKHDATERERREKSDFLSARNSAGQVLDFHSLRHTCGAWLSLAGTHPKVVQTVMRHSTITLTLDTYGHLFPGQEADAVDRLGKLLATSVSCDSEFSIAGAEQVEHNQEHKEKHNPDGVDRLGAAGSGELWETIQTVTVDAPADTQTRSADHGEPRRSGAKVSLSGLEPETYGSKVQTRWPIPPGKSRISR